MDVLEKLLEEEGRSGSVGEDIIKSSGAQWERKMRNGQRRIKEEKHWKHRVGGTAHGNMKMKFQKKNFYPSL